MPGPQPHSPGRPRRARSPWPCPKPLGQASLTNLTNLTNLTPPKPRCARHACGGSLACNGRRRLAPPWALPPRRSSRRTARLRWGASSAARSGYRGAEARRKTTWRLRPRWLGAALSTSPHCCSRSRLDDSSSGACKPLRCPRCLHSPPPPPPRPRPRAPPAAAADPRRTSRGPREGRASPARRRLRREAAHAASRWIARRSEHLHAGHPQPVARRAAMGMLPAHRARACRRRSGVDRPRQRQTVPSGRGASHPTRARPRRSRGRRRPRPHRHYYRRPSQRPGVQHRQRPRRRPSYSRGAA